MLLTCPSCSMRYVVADASIGEAGRKVRCAACGHQWFQEGAAPASTDETGQETTIEAYDIPDAVKPDAGDSAPPVSAVDAQGMREKDLIARVCGFFAAFLVFLAAFLMLVLFKGPVVQHFPPSVMFYELIKLTPPVPGEGLIIDQLRAGQDGDSLLVEGRIINLTTKEIAIPPLALFILDKDGGILATHPVTVGAGALAGESDIDVQARVLMIQDAVSARVGFHFPR